jgi:hypothetical protein
MSSICNAERVRFGGLSGRGGFVRSLSVRIRCIMTTEKLEANQTDADRT